MEINWKMFNELDTKTTKEIVNGFFRFMNMPNYVQENTSINFNNAIESASELSGLIYEERVDTENYGGGYYGANFMGEYFDWDGFKLVMIEEDSMTRYAIDNLQSDEEKAIKFLEKKYPELLIED